MRYLIVVALLVCAGCSLSPSAEFIEAMGKDPASVCFKLTTVYGTMLAARTAIVDGNVTCNGDGLTVKSNGSQIGVPVNIVPTITIGPAITK